MLRPALPRPDFLRPLPGPGWLAWAWCVCGALVLMTSALDLNARWQRDVEQAAMAARQRSPQAAPAPSPEQLAREAEAARWLARLAHPWPEVWAAAEQAPAGLRWQSFDHGQQAPLRLVAEIAAERGEGPAWQWLAAVRDRRLEGAQAWTGVRLASLQRSERGLRVELQATLSGPDEGRPAR